MNNKKITALLLAAAMGCAVFTSCGDKKDKSGSDSSSASSSEVSDAEKETETFDSDNYNDKIIKDLESAEASDEPLSYGSLGETITPAEDDDDSELGSYRVSDSGIKLYFDETEFPEELMLTLEQYFNSFANVDYNTYSRCSYPDYTEKMQVYLKKEFGYDMKNSFAAQCTNLANTMNGNFEITRIRLDVPPQYDETKDNLEAYFENFTDILGENYYEELRKGADKIYDGEFYVMAKGHSGTEQLLVSAYEIVMVEKDGRYYIFG